MPEKEEFSVTTIWKNSMQFGPNKGDPYWTFVLEDGSRVSCYDPAVIEELGIDMDERRTDFEEPETFELFCVEENGKTIIVGEDYEPKAKKSKSTKGSSSKSTSKGKSSTPWKGRSSKSPEEQAQIRHMNVLRTAVDFTGYQKVKSLAKLKEHTEMFEKYVKTGKF